MIPSSKVLVLVLVLFGLAQGAILKNRNKKKPIKISRNPTTTPPPERPFRTERVQKNGQTVVITFTYKSWNLNCEPTNNDLVIAKDCIDNWAKKQYTTSSKPSGGTILTCGGKRKQFRLDGQGYANSGASWKFAIQTGDCTLAQVNFPFEMLQDPKNIQYNPKFVEEGLRASLRTWDDSRHGRGVVRGVDITNRISDTIDNNQITNGRRNY